jgi:DNA-binding transcriptional LysR family regulator
MELRSTTAIKAAAVGGGSPAVLSALSVDAELHSGQLLQVACTGLRLERTIRAIWAGGRTLSPPAARLVAIAAAQAA